MYGKGFQDFVRVNLSNIPGWQTHRKIIVIESDDWGSIRTRSKEAFETMRKSGLNVDSNHYNSYDSLESEQDLLELFSVLSSYKDSTGRCPVFTSLCIMGNPDFQKIEESEFQQYFFQPLDQTVHEYEEHGKLLDLWRFGKENRLFVPALHGREHINVHRYLQMLQSRNEGMRISFRQRSIGSSAFNGVIFPNYLGALSTNSTSELPELHAYLIEAGILFETYLGEKPLFFVAPNAEEPKELESTLKKIGVKYVSRAKRRKYPTGHGGYNKEWNWIGKENEFGQTILTRNCFFEPVCFGEKEFIKDWVGNCLQEIETAFRWNKPAVISTHRVNYIGYIEPNNRSKGLSELSRLLGIIIKKWPQVEFLTSMELGDLIVEKAK